MPQSFTQNSSPIRKRLMSYIRTLTTSAIRSSKADKTQPFSITKQLIKEHPRIRKTLLGEVNSLVRRENSVVRPDQSENKENSVVRSALREAARKLQTTNYPMEKIHTEEACPPAGPYTQAIRVPSASLIFVSGQIPADTSGTLIEGSIAQKTASCIQNASAILKAANSGIEKVVKVTVFLDDMSNFAEMNGEYEKWFAHKPARSCVAVKTLPKGVPVEVEVVALA